MKVLHLFSNYKFTGPADPAMILASTLADENVDVTFCAGRDPAGSFTGVQSTGVQSTGVQARAKRRGLNTVEGLRLPKHGRPFSILRDVIALREMLRDGDWDLIHCHLPNDHFTAVLTRKKSGVPVVRTLYEPRPETGFRARTAYRATAGACVFSTEAGAALREIQPDIDVEIIAPSVDLERFAPVEPRERGFFRESWGAGPETVVFGVVARMQKHRLFPELIEGFARAAADDPRLRMVVLGRGTHQESVAHEPARLSGVGDRIVFPGYIGDDYPRAIGSFDALVFLVPGSDGTCRAAREALSSGVPVVASRRGLLPSFVEDDVNGMLLRDETPAAMAEAIRRIAVDADLRARLGARALAEARAHFAPAAAARHVTALYRRVLEK